MKEQEFYVNNGRNQDGSIDVTMNFPDLESYLEMVKLFPILANGDFIQNLVDLQEPNTDGNWELTNDDITAVSVCKNLADIYDRFVDISRRPDEFSGSIVRELDRDSRGDVKWLTSYITDNRQKAEIISNYFKNITYSSDITDAIYEFDKLVTLVGMYYKLINDEPDGHWHTHMMKVIGKGFLSSSFESDIDSPREIIDAFTMMIAIAVDALASGQFDFDEWFGRYGDNSDDKGILFYYTMMYQYTNIECVMGDLMAYRITENDRFVWMLINNHCSELVNNDTIELIDLIKTFEHLLRD